MKTLIITLFSILLLTQVSAQDKISLDDFDEISVSGSIDVLLKKSSEQSAMIQVDDEDRDDLKVEVSGKKLKIGWKNSRGNWGKNKRKAYVTVNFVELERVNASAAASVESNDEISAKDFEVKATSAAKIELNLKTEKLKVRANSAGKVRLSGSTDYQDVDVNSAGRYDGYDLISNEADAEANSAGRIELFVTKKFEAEAGSSGSIRYKGDPKNTNIDVSISGSIKKK